MATNPNMVAIQTVTVSATSAANIEFTNIPQDYTDLYVVISARTDRSDWNDNSIVRFNSDSGNNYNSIRLNGEGSTVSSSSNTGQNGFFYFNFVGDTATSNTFCNNYMYIPNYTSSNKKSFSADRAIENNSSTANLLAIITGLWTGTSAITSISIAPYYGTNFKQYSTATLYGVTSAAVGAKATGGIISETDTHWIHTFTASGTFTPTVNLTADYLVVAGGGGGGCNHGGGGAGGLRSTVTATGGGGSLESALSLTGGTGYTVTVGAGGAGATYTNRANVTSGSNSVFSTITSTGGGYGSNDNRAAATGGSGGGGSAGGTTGASGTANQGYAGGNAGNSGAILNGGGGGGAGAVGGNGNAGTNVAGNGGAGVATSITGSSVTYGGGGGGSSQTGTAGSGGSGGGGVAGAIEGVATSGTVNTGGGGGASAGGSGTSGSGGSGIVIVRYAK